MKKTNMKPKRKYENERTAPLQTPPLHPALKPLIPPSPLALEPSRPEVLIDPPPPLPPGSPPIPNLDMSPRPSRPRMSRPILPCPH